MTTTGTGTDDARRSRYAQSSAGSSRLEALAVATRGSSAYANGRQRLVRERPVDPALAVARAEHRQVDREEDRREAGVERLGDQLVGDAVVAEDVDLEEAHAVRSRGRDLRGARGRERREADRRPRRSGGSRHPLLAVRVRHRAGRRRARRRPGERPRRPSTVVAVETSSIPQRTRWRSRQRRERRRRSRRASARAPAPPRKYSAQSGSSRSTASASTSVSVSGVSTRDNDAYNG